MSDDRTPAPVAAARWTEGEIEALCRGVVAILECPDLATAARQILSCATGLIPAGAATVVMLPAEGDGVISTLLPGGARQARLPPQGAAARRLREALARVGPGFIENRRPRREGLPIRPRGRAGLKNLLAAPIRLEGATVGVICLGDKPGGFAEHDLAVTAAFGALAGVTHERCAVADRVARSEERFRSIFAQSPIAIAAFDAAGRLRDGNRAFAGLFGATALPAVPGLDLFGSRLLTPAERGHLRRRRTVRKEVLLDGDGVPRRGFARPDGTGPITVDALVTPLLLADGRSPFGYLLQAQDVSDLRRATQQLERAKETLEQRVAAATRDVTRVNAALREKVHAAREARRQLEAEHTFRSAVEDSLLTGILVVDREERLTHVNRSFCRMVGWSREELIGRVAPFPFWPPEDRVERLERFRRLRTGPLPAGGILARYQRRDGERFDVRLIFSRLRGPGGRVAGLVASVSDFTLQIEKERALRASAAQLKSLANQLLAVEERERKRISRELHDSLGQTLSALKYRLEEALAACGREGCRPLVRGKLDTAIEGLGGAIVEVRRIVSDLRPSILDDLGLTSAIGWFCREFGQAHPGTRVALRVAVAEAEVPEQLKITVFRLLQESLSNAAEHGHATRVAVRLAKRGTHLDFSVKDDGRGFAPDGVSRGVGLLGMNERTELSGGAFAVTSRPGRGTLVRATWRLDDRR
jgi:PAS domain S-box-containing protein